MLKAKAISLVEANQFVANTHRHHMPVHRDKFRCAAYAGDRLCGVIQVGRPVSRMLDDGQSVEVVRLATDGAKNACSFLYARAAQAAKSLGFSRIITYILENESGISLEAAGWRYDGATQAKHWSCPSRPRETTAPTCAKKRYIKHLKEIVL